MQLHMWIRTLRSARLGPKFKGLMGSPQVHLRGMRGGLSGRERLHVLNTCISLSCEQQVRQAVHCEAQKWL